MPDLGSQGFDVEGALIDSDLLMKYRLVNRAIETLLEAVKLSPRNTALREKLREIYIDTSRNSDAAQECMDLAALYIATEKLELANERLLEAKRLDPRVSITARLRQLEGSGRSAPAPGPPGAPVPATSSKSITGDLADINIFDIVQILENSRMTGILTIGSNRVNGSIFFNDGRVVDAVMGTKVGIDAFGDLIDCADGQFEFEKTASRFQMRIEASSNTSLILDVLREKDETRAGVTGSHDEFVFGDGM
jgi:hypothetical protein